MDVIRAKTAGFCMGVRLALDRLDKLLAEGGADPVYILGPIIHNPQVLADYSARGVRTAKVPEDIPAGAWAVIRAHGVPQEIEAGLRARGVELVDATCPKVKKAQKLIARHAQEGRFLLLYGEEHHPEVVGLLSYAAAGSFVFETPEQLAAFPLEAGRKYCLAAQTTQDKTVFEELANGLAARGDIDLDVLQTICHATKLRQEEAVDIARRVQAMVVVGGFDSGNTRRLAQVVAAQGTPCVHVETPDQLSLADYAGLGSVGLTAGASTPQSLIDAASRLLEELPGA